MRIFRTALIASSLGLAACGGSANERDPNAELVECALDAATAFTRDCTVDRSGDKEGLVLTIGREDKGYRRFVVPGDGRGLVAADGADVARLRITGDQQVEVEIGRDRYRLPATIRQGG